MSEYVNSGSGVLIRDVHGNVNLDLHLDTPEACRTFSQTFRQFPAMDWASLDRRRYNLFVLQSNVYSWNSFSVSCDRALLYTSQAYYARYLYLTPENQTEILDMPCLFATRNHGFCHTDVPHPAGLGRLTRLVCQNGCICFQFMLYGMLEQERINEEAERFGIFHARLTNELDEEHWAIRDGDLIGIVRDLGIPIC